MTTGVTSLAVELAGDGIWPPADWQLAIDGCGSEERVRWLLEQMPTDKRFWTPELLITTHAAARLLELGPCAGQAVHAPT